MASKYIDKDFYLPDNMLNSSKTEVMIEYDDFIYDQGMIPVNFNYNLDLDDIHYLLKLIADEASLKYEGDMFKFLMVILDKYEELTKIKYFCSPNLSIFKLSSPNVIYEKSLNNITVN